MRAQILTGVVGSDSEYQILGTLILCPGTRTPHYGIIASPSRARLDGRWFYKSPYAAAIWSVVVSKAARIPGSLAEDGTMTFLILDATDVPSLRPGLLRWTEYIRERLGR
jgi:hypothetical protein